MRTDTSASQFFEKKNKCYGASTVELATVELGQLSIYIPLA